MRVRGEKKCEAKHHIGSLADSLDVPTRQPGKEVGEGSPKKIRELH